MLKTLFYLLANYGYGWDIVEIENSEEEIKTRFKEYSENTTAALRIKRII